MKLFAEWNEWNTENDNEKKAWQEDSGNDKMYSNLDSIDISSFHTIKHLDVKWKDEERFDFLNVQVK